MILVLLAPPPDSPRMRAQTGLTEVGVSIRLIEIGSNWLNWAKNWNLSRTGSEANKSGQPIRS